MRDTQAALPRFTAIYLFEGLHGVIDDALSAGKPVRKTQLIRKVQQHCVRLVAPLDRPVNPPVAGR